MHGHSKWIRSKEFFRVPIFFRYFIFMKKKTYGRLVIKPFHLNTSFTYESLFWYILMNNEEKITK